MTNPWLRGITGGLACAALSIAANLWRGDPHQLSGAPSLWAAVLLAVIVSRAVREAPGVPAGSAALRVTLAAAATCALAMGLFTWRYFSSHPLPLAAASAVMSFVAVGLVGLATAWAAPRLRARART